jgi:hypothetical protein
MGVYCVSDGMPYRKVIMIYNLKYLRIKLKSKLLAPKVREQIQFWKCLLPFIPESFDITFVI